jgi:hypothetical protein
VARIDQLLGHGVCEDDDDGIDFGRHLYIDTDGYEARTDPELRNLCFRVDWADKNRTPSADPAAQAREARMARIAADEARLLQTRSQRAQGVIRAHR